MQGTGSTGLYLLVVVGLLCAVVGVLGGFYWAHRSKGKQTSVPPTPFSRVLGLSLLMLAVASAGQLVYFQNSQRNAVECQYEVNALLIASRDARANPVDNQTQRLVDLIRSIRDSQTQEQTRAAMDTFMKSSEVLREVRAGNPYPDIHKCR